MKNLSIVEMSREEFLSWMGGSGEGNFDRFSASAKPRYKQGTITLLWDKSEVLEEAKPLIVVAPTELRDFFAFVGTYVTTFRPYTAFFRVVSAEIAPAFQQQEYLSREVTRRVARLVAGSALSESYLRTGGPFVGVVSKAQLPSMMGTLSASLGQAVIAGYPTTVFDWLSNQWGAIHRSEHDAAADKIGPDQIAFIWKMVSAATRRGNSNEIDASLGRSEQAIVQFLAKAIDSQGVNSPLLQSLASNMSLRIPLAEVLLSSREERITILNNFVTTLDSADYGQLVGSFLAGLLLAISGNGSFDLLRSARQLLNRVPMSLVWFGICAALFEESNVLTTANCAGRRLVRDLERPRRLFGLPSADINSYEYLILRSEIGAIDQINSRSPDGFEVELLADVTTLVLKNGVGRESRITEDIDVLAGSLQEIRAVVERAQRRLRYTSAPRQGEMFRSDEKPRGRSR